MFKRKIAEAYPSLVETEVSRKLDEQLKAFVIERVVELDIDPDVLKYQAEEINRLNNYIDKYSWHNLKENPNDLPNNYEVVLVTYVSKINGSKKTHNLYD